MNTKEKISKWESQVKKGLLEYLILLLLSKQDYYGYEMIKQVKRATKINITEGTIYPLLSRLKRDQFIESRWIEMESGIPRKYYSITPAGRELLNGMNEGWSDITDSIRMLLEEP